MTPYAREFAALVTDLVTDRIALESVAQIPLGLTNRSFDTNHGRTDHGALGTPRRGPWHGRAAGRQDLWRRQGDLASAASIVASMAASRRREGK